LYSVIVICVYGRIVGVSRSDVKIEEQTAVSGTEQHTTAGDENETSTQSENIDVKQPQHVPKLEASGEKEVVVQDSKETVSAHHNIDEENPHDAGPVLASQPKEGQQSVPETQTEEEGIAIPDAVQQQENWQNLPELEESEGGGQVADEGHSDARWMSQEPADQVVSNAEACLTSGKSVQQGCDDAVESGVTNEKEIQRDLTDEQHALSRL